MTRFFDFVQNYIVFIRHPNKGIGDSCRLDDRASILGWGRIFSSPPRPDWLLGNIHPPLIWIPRAISPGLKLLEREADFDISSEVRAQFYLHPMHLHGVLFKYRDKSLSCFIYAS
jgi:hypothetical protein